MTIGRRTCTCTCTFTFICTLTPRKGDVNTALVEFRNAEKKAHGGRPNVAPLLAQAGVHFNAGRLTEALKL